jgi:hypothetical protein
VELVRKKENKEPVDSEDDQKALTAGAPDIARPDKRQGAFIRALFEGAPLDKLKALFNELLPYEKQLAFVYAWFFERLEEVKGSDIEPANSARGELQTLLRNVLEQLEPLALDKKDRVAKQWAGRLLAHIYKRIEKHHKKLSKANIAYAEECTKVGSKSVTSALFPLSRNLKVVQRELKKAVRYRKRLILLSGSKDWRESAKKKRIPEMYWPLVKFPEFSMKSEARWWEFLEPLIQRKIDLSKMPPLQVREYDRERIAYNSRTGKITCLGGKRNRKRYFCDIGPTAHDHLKLLARVRDAGIS